MGNRRRTRLVALSTVLIVPAFSIACNAILGNEERQIDQRGERDQRSPDAADTGNANDSGGDGTTLGDVEQPDGTPATVTIVVKNTWKSLNQAQFSLVDGGVTITGFTAPAGHPMIVPDPMPAIPSDNYTVEAVVRAPTFGEWGVMTRVTPTGAGALFGSSYGAQPRPFTGSMGPPDFNPTQENLGPSYDAGAGTRYRMRLKVEATQTSGKMWQVGQPEPPAYQVVGTAPANGARAVGYYVYNVYDVVLESMTITVP